MRSWYARVVQRDDTPQGRVQIMLELYALAEAQLRTNLKRRRPALSRSEIDRELRAWRQKRPSAGDADGRVVEWPRRRTSSKRRSDKR